MLKIPTDKKGPLVSSIAQLASPAPRMHASQPVNLCIFGLIEIELLSGRLPPASSSSTLFPFSFLSFILSFFLPFVLFSSLSFLLSFMLCRYYALFDPS